MIAIMERLRERWQVSVFTVCVGVFSDMKSAIYTQAFKTDKERLVKSRIAMIKCN